MAAFVIERNPVNQGLLAMIRSFLLGGGLGSTDLRIEMGEAPRNLRYDNVNKLIDPYAILYPIVSIDTYGSFAHPDDGGKLLYQVTSVGRTDESAVRISDRIRLAILERSANGSFTRTINAGGSMTVIDRRQASFGMAIADAGLWNVPDLFELEVQAGA